MSAEDAPIRFWAKVEKTDGCWLWHGKIESNGYGRFRAGGPQVSVHRWSYEQVHGSIPEGLHLDHLCRVRNCVNPEHLEAVTCRENVMRSPVAPAAINARKTHCTKGHPLDDKRICRVCRAIVRKRYWEKNRERWLVHARWYYRNVTKPKKSIL